MPPKKLRSKKRCWKPLPKDLNISNEHSDESFSLSLPPSPVTPGTTFGRKSTPATSTPKQSRIHGRSPLAVQPPFSWGSPIDHPSGTPSSFYDEPFFDHRPIDHDRYQRLKPYRALFGTAPKTPMVSTSWPTPPNVSMVPPYSKSTENSCPYLHRTAGDTERRYHLKYYKTGICIYDTDTRGFCVKNGPHCAFAHGVQDLRNPVFDVREMEANGSSLGNGNGLLNGNLTDAGNGSILPNSLDKERNALNEDPRWQDNIYVLANYKTELCKRPPRLCRQGYACPQYHNSKDKRRTPKSFKYRSTPCPNVKQGDEWGDPINCEAGDACQYCHTRTEQQFHPEIYKSTKCHDIQQTGYCPRGPFCAFAHNDSDETLARFEFPEDNSVVGRSVTGSGGGGSSKAGSVASSLPDHYNSLFSQWSSGQVSSSGQREGDKRTSLIAPSPGERAAQFPSSLGAIGSRPRSFSTSITTTGSSQASNYLSRLPEGRIRTEKSSGGNVSSVDRRGSGIYDSNSPIFSSINAHSTSGTLMGSGDSGDYGDAAGTVGSMVGSVLDDATIDDAMANIAIDAAVTAGDPLRGDHSYDHHQRLLNGGDSTSTNSILGSAPVNIPGQRIAGSGGNGGCLNVSPPFGGPYNPHNNSHVSSFVDPFGPFGGGGQMGNISPSTNASNVVVQAAASILEINRLKEELAKAQKTISSYEESMNQAVTLWQAEKEESRQREEQLKQQLNSLKMNGLNGMIPQSSSEFHSLLGDQSASNNLENMSGNQLQQLKQRLKEQLDTVDQICRHRSSSIN